MSTLDARPSDNGHGSHAWCESWTHFSVDRRSPGYCRVTFGHPPVDTITATIVAELSELLDLIEADPDLDVVVFDSARPELFLAEHGVEDMASWTDVLVRLSRLPASTIAATKGRVRGAGSEFVHACDLLVQIRLVADARLDAAVEAIAERLARSPRRAEE